MMSIDQCKDCGCTIGHTKQCRALTRKKLKTKAYRAVELERVYVKHHKCVRCLSDRITAPVNRAPKCCGGFMVPVNCGADCKLCSSKAN